MASTFHESTIEPLGPAPDGSNKVFTAPTKYVPGSFKLVWNGQVYEPDDTKHGWVENVDEQSVTLTNTPRIGDVLQAFYQDQTEIAGIVGVGSPFAPGEC